MCFNFSSVDNYLFYEPAKFIKAYVARYMDDKSVAFLFPTKRKNPRIVM